MYGIHGEMCQSTSVITAKIKAKNSASPHLYYDENTELQGVFQLTAEKFF